MSTFNKNYTSEEIKSIKENLKKAFGIEYMPINLHVNELYKTCPNKFKPKKNDVFYFYQATPDDEWNLNRGWHSLRVTYVRSGIIFFKYDVQTKESWMSEESVFIKTLIPSTVYLKDLGIPDKNLELFTFNKGKCPYDICVISNDMTTTYTY